MYSLLVDALAVLLDGRRRPADSMLALGVVDEVAPADALAAALGVAGEVALGRLTGALWSPLTDEGTRAFPNVERDTEIQRLLAHHVQIPREAPARAVLELAALGFRQGLAAGLAAEAREFGRLVASPEGRAGLDRFLARRSLPLPLRRLDVSRQIPEP
jgi:enoyl-CoA hydratase/carnithine racemase